MTLKSPVRHQDDMTRKWRLRSRAAMESRVRALNHEALLMNAELNAITAQFIDRARREDARGEKKLSGPFGDQPLHPTEDYGKPIFTPFSKLPWYKRLFLRLTSPPFRVFFYICAAIAAAVIVYSGLVVFGVL